MLVVVSVVAGCQELFFNVVFFVEAAVCCLLAFCCCASVKVVYFLVLQTLKFEALINCWATQNLHTGYGGHFYLFNLLNTLQLQNFNLHSFA